MDRFTRAAFEQMDASGREALSAELARVLFERLSVSSDFHGEVQALVNALRGLGHDLWSFGEADEIEVWCPNYHALTGPGLVVTFRPDRVEVEWSSERALGW